jgi:peptidoglycan/xylan/chitin deacetylase (PgdA/CDA1 family)
VFADNNVVPVVMFHSVGLTGTDWAFSHLSEPVALFDEKIHLLKRAGYQFIFWPELYEHMAGTRKVSRKSVMLTFDDGYLDNWVHAFPVLKKYGAKVTVFVSPDFVESTKELRPTAEVMGGDHQVAGNLEDRGFLSWGELKALQDSGLVDIQSHAMTHTWHFSGPRLLGFHSPGDHSRPWLAWNLRPERKPFYMREDQSHLIPLGLPVYEHEKSLICRRFQPPPIVADEVARFVEDHGGQKFFREPNWSLILQDLHERLFQQHRADARIETESQHRERVAAELQGAKEQIEQTLEKQVDFLCWPGGGYDDAALDVAKDVGYKAWTLSSRDRSHVRNRPGADPRWVKRVGSCLHYPVTGGERLGFAPAKYLLSVIERHRGSLLNTWLGRAMVLKTLIHSLFSNRSTHTAE